MSSRSRRIYAVLFPLLAVLAVGNLFYGAVPVPPAAVWDILTGGEAVSAIRWPAHLSSA